jgi:hypothetical protein
MSRLYARTDWSLYRARRRAPFSAGASISASGAGATATTSAPTASAAPIVVAITGFRLITKGGAAQASLTGITAEIRKAVPSSGTAPDKVVTGIGTDGSGNLSSIDISDIQSTNAAVWLTLYKDGSPARGTTVKVTPTVS